MTPPSPQSRYIKDDRLGANHCAHLLESWIEWLLV